MYMRFIALLAAVMAVASSAVAEGNLPTVFIDTPGSKPADSRDKWVADCRLRVVSPDGIVLFETKSAEIKGRGHSTLAKPKKPMAIRLGKRTPLLGMAGGKRWVLLADFMDHSRLRNRLALAMARATCMDWTPACRHVDVVLNGRPQGCYLLAEQVRVARGRVDIDERRGVLLEVDAYDDGDPRFVTAVRRLPVNVKSPSKPSAAMVDSIRLFLDEIEQNLYSSPQNGRFEPWRHMRLDTFADWWLVNEMAQNAEPNGPRSCYMYRDAGGLLAAGPVWDFDLAFITVGLDGGGPPQPPRCREAHYRQRLQPPRAVVRPPAFRLVVCCPRGLAVDSAQAPLGRPGRQPCALAARDRAVGFGRRGPVARPRPGPLRHLHHLPRVGQQPARHIPSPFRGHGQHCCGPAPPVRRALTFVGLFVTPDKHRGLKRTGSDGVRVQWHYSRNCFRS